MDLQLFQDLTPEERREMLDAQADEVTEENFLQPYTEAEMRQQQKEYVKLSIELADIQGEEDDMKAEFKERKAPIKKSMDSVLSNIRQKGEYVKGKLFKIVDQDERVTGFYNEEGVLVSQRKALPAELNSPTLFAHTRTAVLKTGTTDK